MDHPRGCGDKLTISLVFRPMTGSPPRMRGQAELLSLIVSSLRITPADAGTRDVSSFFTTPLEDHPRGCGDKCTCAGVILMVCGSPPRMRGQVQPGPHSQHSPRITPADAGTRYRLHPAMHPLPDHPRGCGDKLRFHGFIIIGSGSPPRMRGQEGVISAAGPWGRITPADAGTSFMCLFQDAGKADHPRGCGDKGVSGSPFIAELGSPPRMRGQVEAFMDGFAKKRITPADAGTSAPVPV